MTKRESHIFFLLVVLYLSVHFCQHHDLGPALMRFYAKDLLLVPFLILGIKATGDSLGFKIRIGLKELILTILVCSLAFEWIFPSFGMAFATDFVDIICYLIGGILYFVLFLRKKINKKSEYIFETP